LIASIPFFPNNSEHETQKVLHKPLPTMKEPVSMSAQGVAMEGGQVIVRGATNLPTGTELMVTLGNDALGVYYQDDTVVNHGQFSFGPLGQKTGLTDAKYFIDITMPLPFTQPERIQEAVGHKGEYLTGSLVQKDSLGNFVEFKTSYSVGKQKSQATVLAAHNKKVAQIRSSAFELLAKGQHMESLRSSSTPASYRQCGMQMRTNQKAANQLSAEADTLGNNYLNLKVATSVLGMCVSCLDSAMESCQRVSKLLNQER
jgi:hypothetical protein